MSDIILVNCFYYTFYMSEKKYNEFLKFNTTNKRKYDYNENNIIKLKKSISLKTFKSSSSNLCDLEDDKIVINIPNESNKRICLSSNVFYKMFINTFQYFFL